MTVDPELEPAWGMVTMDDAGAVRAGTCTLLNGETLNATQGTFALDANGYL